MEAMTEGISEHTIVDRIELWGGTEPDTPAFIFRGLSSRYVLTRADVLDLSSRFAYRLTRQGIKAGDVVCISLPNSPERVIVEFGVQLAGAVSMNGQVLRADGQDLAESINKTKCKLVVLDRYDEKSTWKTLKHYFEVLSSERDFLSVQSDAFCSVTQIAQCTIDRKTNDFVKCLKDEKTYVYNHTGPSDLASIFTTSGSSGYTKLVKHSHRNIILGGMKLNKCTNLSPPQTLYMSSPLGWLGGYPGHYLFSGCPRVMMDVSAQDTTNLPLFLWNMICEERINTAAFLPVHVDMLHGLAKDGSLKGEKLKTILTGGQPVTKNNLASIGLLTESFRICYGATELGYIAAMNVRERDLESYKDWSTGYALPGVNIKIDTDGTSVDNRGEILVKSDTLCQGYVDSGNCESLSAAFMADGWFRTGDVGYMTKDGCLTVEGRSNDAIMHGAYILYPTWLEQKLVLCPGIRRIVIVPVPDPVLHHEICACVITEMGEKLSKEEIINFCRKQLALDASSPLNVVPKYVVFFESFPLTSSEKLDRTALTKNAILRLGL